MAAWIADHPDVSASLVHDIVKYRDQVCITKDMNVTAVQEQLSINQARMEVANIEHQYQGFHLSECICNLPKTEVTLGRYKAYIMEGDDPRQVMLGYDTDCCQHYDGAGESAMMYGLINPDAGFFVIEDTKTGRILAQAETWQDTDGRRLVFDNIEFADDRQVSQFAPVLSRWCTASPYPDILMGNGYNKLTDDRIRTTEGIEPPMKDAYYTILEQEEDYNYDEPDPYTDADNSCSLLKKDGCVEPYFMEEEQKYLQSLPKLTLTKENIGTFIDPASGGPVRLSGDVTIPDIMMDSNDTLHVVTGLNGTFTDNKDITSVFIPDTVTSCTEDTFAGCDQLQEVEMTDDLQAAMEHEAEIVLSSTEDLDLDDELEDR